MCSSSRRSRLALKARLALLVAVVVVEALGRDEDLAAVDARGVDRLADGALVFVRRGGVEVAVAGLERAGDDLLGFLRRHLKDAEAELGDLDIGPQRDAGDLVGCAGHMLAVALVGPWSNV